MSFNQPVDLFEERHGPQFVTAARLLIVFEG
jgi:hypothetical protein